MRQPGKYKAADIVEHSVSCQAGLKDGRYVPARWEPWQHGGLRLLRHRLLLAWLVFTGRCDALDWEY